MKRLLFLLLLVHGITSQAQSPYTGGNGSGYQANSSAVVVCPFFFGGMADGQSVNATPPVSCPPFFGGSGDGYSSNSGGCTIVLPVKLLDFYGQKETQRNILHWKVSDDVAVQRFDLERSADGTHFNSIGTVAGSTAAGFLYLFIDNNPLATINFYRLRITERSNVVSYSRVIVIRDASSSLTSIYPNPATTSVTLSYYAATAAITTITLYQDDGKIVKTITQLLARGANYITLDLSSLVPGLYFIQIGNSGERVKLVVVR